MSFTGLLINTVVIEKWTPTTNNVNETVPDWTDSASIAASVQERSPRELAMPDIDGPVVIDAVIFTGYRTDIEHLDVLRQTDVTPSRRYRVILPRDPAGRHHHLEVDCQRLWKSDEEVAS